MANRYTDSEKWEKRWFCSLTPTYKLFWNYLCDNCNIAGIWSVNWALVKFHIWNEEPLDPNILGDRVQVLSEDNWFIVGFVEFQQKIHSLDELNPKNKAHLGIIRILTKEGILPKDFVRGFEGASKGLQSPPVIGIVIGNGKGKNTTKTTNNIDIEDIPTEKPAKEPNKYFSFLEKFGQIYQQNTGNPFHRNDKHFALVKRLIDTHGIEEVEKKAQVLAFACTQCSSWFTQNGFADFTIEHLSNQWNSILPQIKKSQFEIETEKLKESREHVNQAIESYRKGKSSPRIDAPIPPSRPPIERGEKSPVS